MKVDIYPNGPLGSNMYIINTDFGCFLIDPSVDPDKVPIDVRPYKIDAILMTHGHFDHINSVDEWKWIYKDSPIFLAEEDQVMLDTIPLTGDDLDALIDTIPQETDPEI